MIKKVIIAVISILIIAGLAAGGYIFYKTTTPEYALYQTMQGYPGIGHGRTESPFDVKCP